MPRYCTVCSHPDRARIDEALVAGEHPSALARRFGVGRDALRRHSEGHLPATLIKAGAAAEAANADNLLQQVRDLQTRCLRLLHKAERKGSIRDATSALREARELIELLGRLAGQLREQSVTLIVNPQWIEVKTVILAALEPHPAALRAVGEALGRLHA